MPHDESPKAPCDAAGRMQRRLRWQHAKKSSHCCVARLQTDSAAPRIVAVIRPWLRSSVLVLFEEEIDIGKVTGQTFP